MSTSSVQILEMRSRGYITVAAAATALRHSKQTIRDRASEGVLESVRMGQLFVSVGSLIVHFGGESPRQRALIIEQLGAVQSAPDDAVDVVIWWCPAEETASLVSPALRQTLPVVLSGSPRRRAR